MLRNNKDVRTVAVVALYFATLGTAWRLAPTIHEIQDYAQAAQLTAWVVACAWLAMTGAIITHNLAHVPVFRHHLINQAFQIAVTLTYGHPVSSFVPGQNLSHHKYTQTRKDYMRSSKVNYAWNIVNLALFMPTVAGPIMRSDLQYTKKQFELQRPFFYRFISELIALQAVNAWLIYQAPSKAILLWFLPHLWAQYAIVAINFMQHEGCEVSDAQTSFHINGARNFTGSILNALLFNNGYHTIHHMHPHLHWSVLPHMHQKLVQPHIDPRLNEPNFVLYFIRHFILTCQRKDFRGKPIRINPEDEIDQPWQGQ